MISPCPGANRRPVPATAVLRSHPTPPFPMPTPLFVFLVWCFLIVVAIRLLRRVPPGVLGGPTNQDDLRGLDNLFPQAHPTATARFLAKEADADFPKKARSQ